MKTILLLFVFVTSICATEVYNENNLICASFFRPNVSYYNAKTLWQPFKNQKFEIVDNMMVMKSLPGGKMNRSGIPIPISYETAEKLEVSFSYQSQGKCSISSQFHHPKRRLTGNAYFNIPPSNGWKKFKQIIDKNRDAFSGGLNFYCSGKDGELKIKDLSVIPIEPKNTSGKRLLLGGKECEAIYYKESDTANTFYDREAAKLLRFMFFSAGGKLIPVKKIKNTDDYRKNAIFIGYAAEKSGVIAPEQLAGIRSGGYAIVVNGNRMAIAGARPSGAATGAVALLKKLGIVYLAPDQITRPSVKDFKVGKFTQALNPAIPLRETNYRVARPELLGYTSHRELANYRMINSHRGNCHAAIDLLPLKEFQDKRPDFFALRADGTRVHTEPGKRVDTHYCMTNKDAQKILADRLLEVMRNDPYASYFYLFPGDGGDVFCCCDACSKLGNPADRLLFWINGIAAQVAKEFPKKKIMTLAYVDSVTPPQHQKPAENVLVLYCPYSKWTQLNIDHPDNKVAKAELARWEEICPNQLGAFTYPSLCTEKLNIWPAFYDSVKLYRRFAEKKFKVIAYCGLIPVYGSGLIPGDNSFCNMSLHVFAQLMCNPKLNVEQAIDEYMRAYYSSAAPNMRKYFDRIHAEVLKRNWSQNCERRIRGFVTQSLADECFGYLDKAELSVANDPIKRRNVIDEKYALLWHYLTDNCRGNGKVTKSNFDFYAKRLAEFCKISRELKRKTYPNNPKKWFWDTAILNLKGKGSWYNEPIISDLINNPVNTLGASLPLCQQETDYGFLISNKGILGGESCKTKWFRRDRVQVKVVRRPSSGFGSAQMLLRLKKTPANSTILKFEGIDNEKKARSMMQVLVNGQSIYKGVAPWGKRKWSEAEFKIPSGVLHAGDNDIVVLNITKDTEIDGVGGDNYRAKRNYTWGWFMLANVKIIIK